MLKITSCFVLFLLIVSVGLSLADTFKCTRPDGSVFFTNDPSQVPSGCVVERVTETPPVGTVPDAPSQPQAASEGKPVVSQPKTDEVETFAVFKAEAAKLAEKYQSARYSAVKSSFVTDKLKARRDVADIKKQKEILLGEINQSSLFSSEKEELRGILSPIGE